MRVLRVMRLHTLSKATAQSVKPVRQVRTPTPVLVPPAPLVIHVPQFPILLQEHAMQAVQAVFKRSHVILAFMNQVVPVTI